MKKRCLSLFLALALVLSLMTPVGVLAVEADHQIKMVLVKDETTFSGQTVLRVDFTYRSNATDEPNNQMIYLKYDADKLYPAAQANGADASSAATNFSSNKSGTFAKNNYKLPDGFGGETPSEVMFYTLISNQVGYICWKVTEPEGTPVFADYTRVSSIFFGLKSGVDFDSFPTDAIKLCEVADNNGAIAQNLVAEVTYGGSTSICYGSTVSANALVKPLIAAGGGVTFEKPAYTGTEAAAPTVSKNEGGTVELAAQTITGETVEYGCSATDSAAGAVWQSSTTFNNLTCGNTYYFFARVRESDSHKAGAASASTPATAAKGTAVIEVEIKDISKTYGEEVTLPAATSNYGTVTRTITKGGNTVSEIRDAGSYTVTYSVAEGAAWTAAEDKTLSVTVSQKTLTDVAIGDISDQTYTGKAITPTPTVTSSQLAYGDSLVKDTDYTVSYENNINAGEAAVTVTAKTGSNYIFSPAVRKTFTISPATAKIKPSATAYSGTYDGAAHEVFTAFSDDSGWRRLYKKAGGTYSDTMPEVTYVADSGTYYVKFTKANYNDVEKSYNVTVNKAAQTAVTPVITAHTDNSITATAVSGQKYQIKPSSEAAPTAAGGGWDDTASFTGLDRNTSYTVYTYIPGGANHNDSPVVSSVQTTDRTGISGTVTINNTAPKYGDTLNADVSGVEPSGATLSYQWYRGATAITSATKSSYTVTADDVGSTIKAVVTATGNYSGTISSSETAAVGKVKAVITVDETAINKIYGEKVTLPAATSNYGTVTRTITKGGNTVSEIRDAGSYTVTYSVAEGAYWNKADDITVDVTVSPKSVTLTVDAASRRYGENNPIFTAQVTGGGLAYSDTVSDLGLGLSSAADKTSSPGSYDVTGDGDYNTNYSVTVIGTNKLTVNKAEGSVNAPVAKALTYNGSAQELVSAGSSSTGEIQYKVEGGSYGKAIPQATDAGKYTVYYKVIGDANHNDVPEQSVEVTVGRLNVSDATVGAFNAMTYTGAEQTPVAAVTKNDLTATGTWSKVTNVADKTTFTASGNFTGTIANQSTGMNRKTVDALDMSSLVTAPVKNAVPQSTFANQTQYTGTIGWNGSPAVFSGDTVYTANLTLTATDNYTFTGVKANSFTYKGAAVTNAADSGTVVITFPKTDKATVKSIAIKSPANKLSYKCGETLDVTGLTITATMDDTTKKDVTVTAEMVTGFDSSAVAASKTLTITYGEKTTTYQISVSKADGPAAPTGLTPVETTDGLPNGKITGTTTAMEYSTDSGFTAANTHNCTAGEITGLAANTYYIRIKETATQKAGEAATVTVTNGKITITWNTGGGKWADLSITNKTTQVAYNGMPTAPETPTKAADAQYTYTFKGWTPAVVKATAATTYTAEYTGTVNKYTVTWNNYDGALLETDSDVPYGTTPTYDGATPTKPADTQYTYTFKGWVPDITAVTGNVTYTAAYTTNAKPQGGGSISAGYEISVAEAQNGVISASRKTASRGDSVMITVTPDNGYTLQTLTVETVAGSKIDCTTVESGSRYSFTMPASGVKASATFMKESAGENFFVDVFADDYYYDAVQWAVKGGITTGTDATHFSPDMKCDRAQMVTFLWRASGCPEPATTDCPFSDVSENTYFYKAVQWAVENGITKGTSETTFSPFETVNRAQAVTFLYRLADGKVMNDSNSFTDVAEDAYYANAVQWAVENGITKGTSETTFSPEEPCLRSQIVTFMYRYFVK